MSYAEIKRTPEVSVLMPLYNGSRWLRQAIESIGAQTLRAHELIIVDDGSTDSGLEIARQAAAADPRISVHRQTHLGICAALNNGIGQARAPVLARMDADDIALPERLERQLAFLKSSPEVAALGSWARIIDDQGMPLGQLTPETRPDRLREVLRRQNPFVHAAMMVRAAAVREAGGYREILEGAEDYDLWLRISEHADVANLPEFLLEHRRHAGSATRTRHLTQLLAARLARDAATRRNSAQPDVLEGLRPPLTLSALEKVAELRPAVAFYRLLGENPAQFVAGQDLRVLSRTDLNHAERKAAQQWLMEAAQHHRPANTRLQALWWLFYLHPGRALELIFRGKRAAG
jgi:glycosyltransferase involved in cell wall biosynthesis